MPQYIKVAKITLLFTCPKCGGKEEDKLTNIPECGGAFCTDCDEDCDLDDEVRIDE